MNGKWWTFWDLKQEIHSKTGRYYDHPTISASIREIRHAENRIKYGLPPMPREVIEKRRLNEGSGWQYRLALSENEIEHIKQEKKNARQRRI